MGLYLAFWCDMELKGLWVGITAALFYAATVSVYVVSRMNWDKEVEKVKSRVEDRQSDGQVN